MEWTNTGQVSLFPQNGEMCWKMLNSNKKIIYLLTATNKHTHQATHPSGRPLSRHQTLRVVAAPPVVPAWVYSRPQHDASFPGAVTTQPWRTGQYSGLPGEYQWETRRWSRTTAVAPWTPARPSAAMRTAAGASDVDLPPSACRGTSRYQAASGTVSYRAASARVATAAAGETCGRCRIDWWGCCRRRVASTACGRARTSYYSPPLRRWPGVDGLGTSGGRECVVAQRARAPAGSGREGMQANGGGVLATQLVLQRCQCSLTHHAESLQS